MLIDNDTAHLRDEEKRALEKAHSFTCSFNINIAFILTDNEPIAWRTDYKEARDYLLKLGAKQITG